MKMKNVLETKLDFKILLGLFVATITILGYWLYTAQPGICDGMGDCVKYFTMAKSFATHDFVSIDYPFHLRLAAPWLASFFAPDYTAGFLFLDAFSALVFVFCLFGIAKILDLRFIGLLILVSWFFLHPLGFHLYIGPVPASIDPLAYAFLGLISLLFLAQKRAAFLAALFISLFVKESFMFVAAVALAAEGAPYFFEHDPGKKKKILLSAASIAAVCLLYKIAEGALTPYLFPQKQPWKITSLQTILYWGHQVLKDPNRLIVWSASFFCATGFFSVFLVSAYRLVDIRKDIRTIAFLLLGAAGYVAFGLLAGADMSRIIFNGNLLILGFCLYVARQHLLNARYIALIYGASVLMALSYVPTFPSTFEYGYYGSKDIVPSLLFLVFSLAVTFALFLVRKMRFFS